MESPLISALGITKTFQFLYGAINGQNRPLASGTISLFQFLYGAINGCAWGVVAPPVAKFQFLYGAINGLYGKVHKSYFPYFNSSMVRLMAFLEDGTVNVTLNFNSSMVRLMGYFGR